MTYDIRPASQVNALRRAVPALARVHGTIVKMADLIDADTAALGLPARPFARPDDMAAHALALFAALQALDAAMWNAQHQTGGDARHDFRFGWVHDAIGKAAGDIAAVRVWALTALQHGVAVPGVRDAAYSADRAARFLAYRLDVLREVVTDYAGV